MSALIFLESTNIFPLYVLIKPVKISTKVDLPDPLSPTIPKISPFFISKFILSKIKLSS